MREALPRRSREHVDRDESAQGGNTDPLSCGGSFGVRRLDGQAEADRQHLGQATPTRPPTLLLTYLLTPTHVQSLYCTLLDGCIVAIENGDFKIALQKIAKK